jgi:hypothetical protein
MWPNIEAAVDAGLEVKRPHVVKEDERAHHPVLRKGQHPTNSEAASQITPPLVYNHVNHRLAPS